MVNTNIDTRQINLFVYDTPQNFDNTKGLIGISLFKNVILIENIEDFQSKLAQLKIDEEIFVAVHVFATMNIKGIKEFTTSGILQEYPKLPYVCVTEKNGKDMEIEILKNDLPYSKVCKYHEISSGLTHKKLQAMSKSNLIQKIFHENSVQDTGRQHFKYAILTALYQDEFEELKNIFDFPEEEVIKVRNKTFKIGYLKGTDKETRVVAGILNETGPVESAVITSIMLELFTPEFILMSGVCGGASDYSFGDIIVAKKIFAFQKGKISDHPSLLDLLDEKDSELDLYDKDNNPVNYRQLYDGKKNHIAVSIDNFEIEHDAMINLDTSIDDDLKEKLNNIQDLINADIRKGGLRFQKEIRPVKIAIEPMASGTMVINKKGYFEQIIKKIDRKVKAVEMESYGLARACQFANDGKTKPIVFKSVMDHTFKKEDAPDLINVKKFAAYTSALFMKYLFEQKVI